MKFSQVEFVGVLVGILGRVRVGLVDNGKGESEGERKRLLGVLGDSCADPLLLHIRKPEEVRIRVEKRERL